MSHTPGPWSIDTDRSITVEVHEENRYGVLGGREIGIAELRSWMGVAEADANARLIAAAPDLLASLKGAVKECRCSLAQRDSGHLVDCFVPAALEAISKAEGRS